MRHLILFAITAFTGASFAQGLKHHQSIHEDFDQRIQALDVKQNDIYSVTQGWASNNATYELKLRKTDVDGTPVYSMTLPNQSVERLSVESMDVLDDGRVFLWAGGLESCDVINDSVHLVYMYNSNGTLDWFSQVDFHQVRAAAALSNLLLLVLEDAQGYLTIESRQMDGTVLGTAPITRSYEHFAEISGSNLVTSKGDSLFLLNASFGEVDRMRLAGDVRDLQVVNDTIYARTNDGISMIPANFTFEQNVGIPGLYQMHVDNDYVHTAVNQIGASWLYGKWTHELTTVGGMMISGSNASDAHVALNAENFVITNNFDPYQYKDNFSEPHMFSSVNMEVFDLTSPNSVTLEQTDARILDFEATSFSAEPQGTPGLYTYQVAGRVLVQNNGNEVMNSVQVTHVSHLDLCRYEAVHQTATGLNLNPGESDWVDLGPFSNSFTFNQADTIDVNMCFYTGAPNGLNDIDPANDEFCEKLVLGYASVEERELNGLSIYPNPSSGQVNLKLDASGSYEVEVYDLLGMNVMQADFMGTSKELQLNHLSDGQYLIKLTNTQTQKSTTQKVMLMH